MAHDPASDPRESMRNGDFTLEPCPPPALLAGGANGVPRCSFTIDVEDWYQSTIDFDAPISDRVLRNVERACAALDQHRIKGTFFVQGRVAETFPRLLRDLLAEGHEIQSHGYSHRPLYAMDRRALRTELELARKTVEDACGVRVTAFRAPDFSIVRENLWALEVLAETGFEIDSSIFPMKMSRYGIDGWEIGPHIVHLPGGGRILEVPVAIAIVAGMRIPVAGGGYIRLLPRWLLERALRSVLASDRPVILYCHPYEFSPEEMAEYRGRVGPAFRITQGIGRASFIRRVHHLLARLPFGRFDRVVAAWGRA
ncbi:MAG TPA: polysaccharide deacetylase family protein [Candidatus Eisenbacteria bacterium]|jgi:polysaccharide deacetylase family protein (PEP-CTERM system associated)